MSIYADLYAYEDDDYEAIIEERRRRTLGDKKPNFFSKGVPENKMLWLEEPVVFDNFEEQVELYFSWIVKMYDRRSRYMAKGWIHKNFETEEAFMKQTMLDYQALLKVVRLTNNKPDQYLCPNVFSFPTTRQASTIREIQAALSDIDQYKIKMDDGTIVGISRAQMYEGMEELIKEGKIPRPNIIIEARGTQGVWLHEPMPFYVEGEWMEFQSYLNKQLAHLGADAKAKDSVRYMRAVGSIHSGINEKVIMKVHSFDRYSFEDLLNYVPDLQVNRRKAGQKSRKTYKENLNPGKVLSNRLWAKYEWGSDAQLRSLHIGKIFDLEKLRDLRNGDMIGCREMACYLYHLWYLRAHGDVKDADEATWSFYQSFNRVKGDEYKKRDLLMRIRSSERDWRRWVINHYDSRYNFTNRWIIDKLGITKKEQKSMKIIINEEEKQTRNTEFVREKRREQGVKERAEYLAEQDKTFKKVKELYLKGLKQVKIAEELDLSKGRVSQLVKRLKQDSKKV